MLADAPATNAFDVAIWTVGWHSLACIFVGIAVAAAAGIAAHAYFSNRK